MVWPKLLDMTRDDSKRVLRRLELEAYSSLVSALRAQGDLTSAKKSFLQNAQNLFSISTERHRAEVRRAINDEKLTTIADNMSGPVTDSEWLVEGRRLIPLMPRLVPQTAFTLTANHLANIQAEKNFVMPNPSQTGNKDLNAVPTTNANVVPFSGKARPSSPTSNVVVLPSGMSIHIKGGLNTEEEDIHKKKKRSNSTEAMYVSRANTLPTGTKFTPASSGNLQGISPMKITFTKSPARSSTTVSQAQKVILVSGSGASTPNILQKSLTVPVVKSTPGTTKGPIVIGSSASNIVTVGTSAVATCTTTYLGNTLTYGKPRPKTVTTTKQTRGIVIPVGTHNRLSSMASSHPNLQSIQIKSVSKPTIQIKQEGSMKIITQSLPSSSKILPKPPSGNPIVMVTSQSSSSGITIGGAKASSTQAGKVLSITTHGNKVIATTTSRPNTNISTSRPNTSIVTSRPNTNIVTVNPKTLQVAGIRGQTITTGARGVSSVSKPNVIVVQKAQGKKLLQQQQQQQQQGQTTPPSAKAASTTTSPFEKEFGSFIQKHEPGRGPAARTAIRVTGHKPNTENTAQYTKKQILVQKSDIDASKSSLLADLIQAAGIYPDSNSGSNSDRGSPATVEESATRQGPAVSAAQRNTWFQYDEDETPVQFQTHSPGGSELQESASDSAIKALLEMQSGAPAKVVTQVLDEELTGTQYQLEQGEVLTLEQAAQLLNHQSGQGASKEETLKIIQNAIMEQNTPSEQQEQGGIIIENKPSGELDPQTGMFFPQSSAVTVTTPSVSQPRVVTLPMASSSSKNVDIFSSAIAQAQIDLDPFQFIEEEEKVPPGGPSALSPSKGGASQTGSTLMSMLNTAPKVGQQMTVHTQEGATKLGGAVTVERVDSNIYEGYTSQKLDDLSSEGGGEGSFLISGTAESDAVRLGKRKRKAPIPADESPSQSSVGGWVRAALGLLQRVSRYRGINRDKGDINAASWFTRPVNPEEAPGYYKIIKNPMDFGTIKRKLEVGQYQNFEAFHEDMLLVRDNCYRYNPPGHDARKDGEEVFSFYEIEYIKMMEKWSNRHHQISPVGSPNVKKLKYDKSPTQDWAALPQQQ
ncbi:unnamed protein product [Owenia fusiformis]|uniref:Uncharacterized protein n=1 Tax=Owenia fusiformis TaxID=6347 RepID=A0A8J1UVG2_OWEFU|nr:unnamed protein product [Owenia fusiformis]